MSMASSAHLWTADQVRAHPDDGNRYEVVDGELLVTPAPSVAHQRAVRELLRPLDAYTTRHHIGEVVPSPADVGYGRGSMVQPDLFVVPRIDGPAPEWDQLGPLLLVIEVLSPSTARRDRFTKRRLYQRQGIPEYWIVDLGARAIERWRPTDERPEVLDERITWQPSHTVEPLAIEFEPLFREVLGS